MRFKNYFRHIYRAYSIAPNKNIAHLKDRLINNTYQSTHPTKIYLPKKSGVLRPYTLLAIEDQIIYQALTNIIANKLHPRVKNRYYKSVFGHLYSGKKSIYFYHNWIDGYKAFSNRIREAINEGYIYSASFDLTACYDSIDHHVIKHFLKKLELDEEFCDLLNKYLKYWSAASNSAPIYHGHGIPQGPQPSGLIAEVILRHFDENRTKSKSVRYFRYVDDIRLFAKSEKELRRRLIELDLLSKEIGLFPQTGKIDIHRVKSVSDEIKTISNPAEPVTDRPDPNQSRIRKRLFELTYRYELINETRFKYVLSAAIPNSELSLRLLRLLEIYPHLYESIFIYLSKSKYLSKKISKRCLEILKDHDLYSSFTAGLINTLRGRIHNSYKKKFIDYCQSRLTFSKRNRHPDIRVAAMSVLTVYGKATWTRIKKNMLWKYNWWVRSELILFLQSDHLGTPSYHYLLNRLIRDKVQDVSIVAAELIIISNLKPDPPIRSINPIAQNSLSTAKIIGRISTDSCPIRTFMINVLGEPLSIIKWKKFLLGNYNDFVQKNIKVESIFRN